MEDNKLEQLFTQLTNTANSLKIAVETYPQEARKVLEDTSILPENCPSRASMAEMTLRRVEKNLRDVEGTFEQILKHIWENYNYK